MAARDVMHSLWTARGVADAVAGAWRGRVSPPHLEIAGVSTDSRSVRPGELFVALRGERFDGHAFVRDALERGAVGAIVERTAACHAADDALLIEVDDTLAALQTLARQWRDALRQGGCTVIAVAGSNGKTTTRHLIHHVLQRASTHAGPPLRGTQSPKSFNNHIGVPLTLLGAAADDDFVVVEVGTSQSGEVAQLGDIVRPDIAVIVSIGREHLEAFETVERVAHEELALLANVQLGGAALIPEDPWLAPLLPAMRSDVELERIGHDARVVASLALPGRHAAHNASAAAQVARRMGVSDAEITAALACVEPVPGRFAVREVGEVTLIDDAYNANPDSMRAALETLAERWRDAPRRVAVIGDMLELGAAKVDAHRELGRFLAQLEPHVEPVVTVGELATFAAAEMRRCHRTVEVHAWPTWDEAIPERVAGLLAPGDVVLLKASRGMRLERVIPAIEAAAAPLR